MVPTTGSLACFHFRKSEEARPQTQAEGQRERTGPSALLRLEGWPGPPPPGLQVRLGYCPRRHASHLQEEKNYDALSACPQLMAREER